jgi:hypothetical protein
MLSEVVPSLDRRVNEWSNAHPVIPLRAVAHGDTILSISRAVWSDSSHGGVLVAKSAFARTLCRSIIGNMLTAQSAGIWI